MARSKKLLVTPHGNIIQRLKDNSVLKEVIYANITFIRFELYPVAEYLSAIHEAKQCGVDRTKWLYFLRPLTQNK